MIAVANPTTPAPANLTTTVPGRAARVAPRTIQELERELSTDARHALHRVFSGYCGTTKGPKALPGAVCDHTNCWANNPVTDQKRQVEMCEITRIPLQAVFGIRDRTMITFRTA